jgi:hypothetical protein
MATRRGTGRRDPAKERHWRRIVRDWRRSGLSARDFCDWQVLSEPSFYAWRRELALRDREAASGPSPSGAKSTGHGTKDRSGRAPGAVFVPVRVVADAVPEAPGNPFRTDGIEVLLPTGVRLLVLPGYDRALLRDVIACCGGMARETPSC